MLQSGYYTATQPREKETIMTTITSQRDTETTPAAVELAAAWNEDPFSHLTVPMD